MIDLTDGTLATELVKATLEKDDTLAECLSRFLQIEENYPGTVHKIATDWAPRSFGFTRYVNDQPTICGGIIYHGPHDNGGDGGAPTFSVSITPKKGWSTHT
jgi:hypothetical protein